MIAATAAVSLYAAIDFRGGGRVYQSLALIPGRVWKGEVWRLVTWAFVEMSAKSLVVACGSLYWFGGDLAARWGQRRFVAFVAMVVLGAGVGTSVIGLVAPRIAWYPHLGGWALGEATLIAWALQFPERRIVIHRVLVVGGPLLAYGTFGFVVLVGVFAGLPPMLPAVLAGTVALLHQDDLRRRIATWRGRRRMEVHGGRPPRGPYATS
jgi:membrane associated rhomboid family serine protease